MFSFSVLPHNHAEGRAFFVRIFEECGGSVRDGAAVFHAPVTGLPPLDDFKINIEFDADAGILSEDSNFFPLLRRMEIERSVLIPEAY